MKGIKNLLGLDISLTSTGLAWYSGNEINTGRICPNMPHEEIPRYLFILEKIFQIIERIHPEVVILEGYSYGSRGSAVYQYAELVGILKFLLHRKNIKLIVVPPTTIKKFVTGSGRADKQSMSDAAYWNWGAEFFDVEHENDMCDAYCLVKYYLEECSK